MGSYFSRNTATQTGDDRLAFVRLFLNFACLGMLLGFLIHNHDIQFWSTFHHRRSFFWGLKWMFYLWYATVWVITYSGVYLVFLRPFLNAIIRHVVGISHELPTALFFELLYGLWACGQIVGGWMDGENSECFRRGTCQFSYMMLMLWNVMESTCEYFFAYEWDSREDAYFRIHDNSCAELFFFAPRLILTLFGSLVSFAFLTVLSES